MATQVATSQSSTEINDKESVYSVTITTQTKTLVLQNSAIKEFYFIEDIFSPSITGKIHIIDTFNIKDFILLTGNELVSVIYGYTTKSTRTFFIYKISRINSASNDAHKTLDELEIFFCDFSFLILTQKQISYSWADKGRIWNNKRYVQYPLPA